MHTTSALIPLIQLDLIQTLAIAGIVYLVGMMLKKKIRILEHLNIPAAVLGGLVFAVINLLAHDRVLNVKYDTSMQSLCMMLFFTSIGLNARLALLKKGGRPVLWFLTISSAFCVIQNLAGIGVAMLFDVPKLFGIMAGSVTLVGGPATGLAFAPLFEQMGLKGAETIAITAATFGIVCGGLLGGPAGTWLMRKFRLENERKKKDIPVDPGSDEADEILSINTTQEHAGFTISLINTIIIMGVGGILSVYIAKLGITLPAYIGAMIVGAVFRNINDKTQWMKMDQQSIDFAGGIALNIFLTVALMDLKLWELFHLALPLAVILATQVLVAILFAVTITFRVMGKNYESAVMASGFVGFMLGTVANAMVVMKTMVAKYGAAPRAFLVVPLVGAFFIDYVNALVITVFVNWMK